MATAAAAKITAKTSSYTTTMNEYPMTPSPSLPPNPFHTVTSHRFKVIEQLQTLDRELQQQQQEREQNQKQNHHHNTTTRTSLLPQLEWSDIVVQSLLGRGGFACVFRVQVVGTGSNQLPSPQTPPPSSSDNNDDNNNHSSSTTCSYYALKCLSFSTKSGDELVQGAIDLASEVEFLSTICHDNIIHIRGVCSTSMTDSYTKPGQKGYFFIMDLCQKETLADRLEIWRNTSSTAASTENQRNIMKKWFTTKNSKPKQNHHHQNHSNSIVGTEKESISSSGSGSNIHSNNKMIAVPVVIPTIQERIQTIAMGIASGMQYLHKRNIILRDLKPENIGFDLQTGIVKVLDFGLAKRLDGTGTTRTHAHNLQTMMMNTERQQQQPDNHYNTSNKKKNYGTTTNNDSSSYDNNNNNISDTAGSLLYMAPEVAIGMSSSGYSSDVYAFGLLLWELLTLEKLYEKYTSNPTLFYKKVLTNNRGGGTSAGGKRPSLSNVTNKNLKRLVQDCWHKHPDTRPNFTRIWLVLNDDVMKSQNFTTTSSTTTPKTTRRSKKVSQHTRSKSLPGSDNTNNNWSFRSISSLYTATTATATSSQRSTRSSSTTPGGFHHHDTNSVTSSFTSAVSSPYTI